MRKLWRAALAAVFVWLSLVAPPAAFSGPGQEPSGRSADDVRRAVRFASPPASDARSIADVRASWIEAVNTLDLHGLLGLYAPGAVLFPAASPARLGVGAISRWHGRWSPDVDVHYTVEATSLDIDGRWALEEWVAEVTVTPGAADDTGIGGDPVQFRQRGVRVYRQDQGGSWRIDRETWSEDHPIAAHFLGTGRGDK